MSSWLENVLHYTSEYFWIFVLAIFIFLLFFWLYKYNRITKSVSEIIRNIEEKTSESLEIQKQGIEKMTEMFLNKLNESVDGQFKSFGKSIDQYTSIQLKSQEEMAGFVRELIRGTRYQININEATESIVESISKYNQQITDVNTDLSASMKNIVELTNTLNDIVDFNKESLKEIKTQKEEMADQYDSYFESLKSNMEAFGMQTSAEMERIANMFAEISGNAIEQLRDTIKTSMDIWTDINNTAAAGLDNQTNNLLTINNEINQTINRLNETLGTAAASFADSVKTSTINTFNQFDEGLSEITKRLSSTIKEIRDSVEDLPEAVEALKKALDER